MFKNTITLLLCSVLLSIGYTLYEGDTCVNNNPNGVRMGMCLSAYECSWALREIQNGHSVVTCDFVGRTPIVCCPINQIEKGNNIALNSPSNTKQMSINNARESVRVPNRDESFGMLSQAKCEEYFPRPKGSSPFAVGAVYSLAEEFPHMAALGYGELEDIQWNCGGSLISLQHVLTAAHCLYSRDLGNVKYIRLGDLDIVNTTDPAEPQDFIVKRSIPHPSYNSETLKNDIAIIELDKPVRLTKYVKPACLQVSDRVDTRYPITASGWGITEFAGYPSSHLLKVRLKIVDRSECLVQYARAGPRGQIDDASQVCAGSADADKIMDTCQGDSGGPLQLLNNTNQKHYHIIGITSFGKACGVTKSAGIYTRVSYHVPWIESIVFNS
ncbi:hypothetical protein WA026_006097 [Henosepilachna vigintioctopunctata]|uniref:Peptidase S1 domain-containing protein n=1 Tax=Henosepilachna vigintioctopunctata TaxID=420089 RepID=A0AAW1TMW2_9CUCU